MKRILLVLGMVVSMMYAWSETNVAPIQDRTRLQDRDQTHLQDRIKLEDQIRIRLRERLKTEDCDRVCDGLFARIREGSPSQKQYEYTLSFVKAYMDRNRKSLNPDNLIEVGEFYQKNMNRLEGTTREKRNALMLEAENRIRNRERKDLAETELVQKKERENWIYSYSYQNRIRQGNISENADKARMMRERREGQSSPGKR